MHCRLFALRDEDTEDDQDEAEDRENSVKFLITIPTQELNEIIQVQGFLNDTAVWNIGASSSSIVLRFDTTIDHLDIKAFDRERMLARGPAVVLHCFESGSIDSVIDDEDMIVRNLPELSAREVLSGRPGDARSDNKIILDEINGELDECLSICCLYKYKLLTTI